MIYRFSILIACPGSCELRAKGTVRLVVTISTGAPGHFLFVFEVAGMGHFYADNCFCRT